jgi:hypothetical protein
MARMLPPPRLPPLVGVVIGETGVGVGAVGVGAGAEGRPGLNGLVSLPWARARPGSARTPIVVAAARTARTDTG